MSETRLSDLMTVAAAAAVLDAAAVEPRVQVVPLGEALGRRLAEDVSADRDYPPFDKALMDGFAVRVAEPAGEFELIGEVPAGAEWVRGPLAGRQAVAIMTGAPLPPGEGPVGVVPVEMSQRVDERTVRLSEGASPGRYVTKRGGDRPAGAMLLGRGTLLGSQQMATLASVGRAAVKVYGRPVCAVLSTGNEVVPVAMVPEASQIRDSNTPQLLALLRALGCEAVDAGHLRDDAERIRRRLVQVSDGEVEEAGSTPMPRRHVEAIFVTGGMSMGEHDYVWRAIGELAEVRIKKLKIKPGKPFVFGIHEHKCYGHGRDRETGRSYPVDWTERRYYFGLPGNPVSAYVCTLILAARLLTRLGGGDVAEFERRFEDRPLAGPLPGNGPRQFYQPARLENGHVVPLAWRGSGDVFTLAEAQVLIERPAGDGPRAAGEAVRVVWLP